MKVCVCLIRFTNCVELHHESHGPPSPHRYAGHVRHHHLRYHRFGAFYRQDAQDVLLCRHRCVLSNLRYVLYTVHISQTCELTACFCPAVPCCRAHDRGRPITLCICWEWTLLWRKWDRVQGQVGGSQRWDHKLWQHLLCHVDCFPVYHYGGLDRCALLGTQTCYRSFHAYICLL